MNEEDQQIEARKRAQEYRAMVAEECPNGGLLYGDLDREQATESRDPKSSLVCPAHLSEAARAEWNRISVEQKDKLTSADAPALAAYCAAYSRWADAELMIQKSGSLVMNKAKNPIPNPYLAIAQQSLAIMRDFLQLLQHKANDTVF